MSGLLDRLRGLSAAEEFFDVLKVPYDPEVLRVARLHILKRMGQYLSEQPLSALSDHAAEEACRDTLARAYNDFVASSPLQERVFKVLKDAVAPANVGFVSLSDIADPDEAA
nr:nitrogenase stabilizing/protective protein NifW [uncultured Rhodopila sp.]